MKIPGSEEVEIEDLKSPFLAPEEAKEDDYDRKGAMDKILGRTDKKEEEAVETPKESAEVIFAKTYIVNHGDIGFTPEEILDRIENVKKEPIEKEAEILNGLLFDGYYEHEFKLGKGGFSLRTISPIGIHRSEKLIVESLGEGEITPFHIRMAMIGRSLSMYMGKKTCEYGSQKEFEAEEAMKERIELALSLPTYVCDAIAESIQAFSNRTQDATRRNLSNF